MAKLRVGINGFGRIGRILFRAGFDKVEIVGVNNSSGTTEEHAHLLKYDSTHGTYGRNIDVDENSITVNGKTTQFSFEKDPAKIPWKKWGADVVFECTGVFKDAKDNQAHLDAGAKKVIISSPAKSHKTFVYGINHKDYNPAEHHIVSNASCTTNCLAPVAKVLNDAFGIEKALMTTIHAFTNDQRILDSYHTDLRRARTASSSMIPTTTGAAKAISEVLPELKGKIHGMAIRVPTPNVSLVDLNVVFAKGTSVEEVNAALIKASQNELKGVLACEGGPLVSIDFNGNPHSAIVDLQSTMALDKNFMKILAWYDNEYGFSMRMIDMANYMNTVQPFGE